MVAKINHVKQNEFLTYILEDIMSDVSGITDQTNHGFGELHLPVN